MHAWFLLFHIVGLILWFGTMAIDAFFIPAARRGSPMLQVWVFGIYRRAVWLELSGLALLLIGGIGMIATEMELLEETWFRLKLGAAVVAIGLRLLHYGVLFRNFQPNPAAPDDSAVPPDGFIQGVERYESVTRWAGPAGLLSVAIVFWMVLWQPT